MGFIKSLLVTAMGFVLGMMLAGVGGLSASTLFSYFNKSDKNNKIETYWSQAGIGLKEVEVFISNEKCDQSELYYKACLNVIAQKNSEKLDLSEKEALISFINQPTKIDFNNAILNLFKKESESKHAFLAAQLINSFLSIYSDPHTYILPTDFYNQVGAKSERSKYFVGVSYEKRNGDFFVLKVSKNSDAEKAGLEAADKIISINGKALRHADYPTVSRILRDENTKDFSIEVERGSKKVQINLARTYRQLSFVQYDSIAQGHHRYGVITLAKFSRGVCEEVNKAIAVHKSDDQAGLILDLRDNPGGQLDEAACVAGLFLGKHKKAYYIEYLDAYKSNEVVLTTNEQTYKGPLVVLINSGSASAAETLSGALQDYKRALLIGRRTFGKGTFQEAEVWALNNNVSLFKTQGFYLLPSRNTTQLVGVTPDIELEEDNFEKREETLFFNPIKKLDAKYPALKESELVGNFEIENCDYKNLTSRSVSQNVATKDVYLQTSLEMMACSNDKVKSIAHLQSSSQFN